VMKSMVLIMAISSESRYTEASSDVSKPTIRFGSSGGVRPESASDRTAGPILAAQPHVLASPVSVFFLKNSIHKSSAIQKSYKVIWAANIERDSHKKRVSQRL